MCGLCRSCTGGFFGALFGGSVYNIQGPTGSLSPILAYYSVSYGQVCTRIQACDRGSELVVLWSGFGV